MTVTHTRVSLLIYSSRPHLPVHVFAPGITGVDFLARCMA